MRKFSVLLSIAAATACLGLSSCSKDTGGSSGKSNNRFYEITIDGTTYKGSNDFSFIALMPTFPSTGLTSTMIINIKGVVDDIIIAHYRATADFERYNKTGKYKIADRADYYAAIQNENFDLIVEFDGSYGEYTVLEGGVHNVTKVKYLGKFDDTDSEYLIEGNFTANYKNSNTNKTIAVSGKYRTFAITVD